MWEMSRFYERFHADDGMTHGIYRTRLFGGGVRRGAQTVPDAGRPGTGADGRHRGRDDGAEAPAPMLAPAPNWDGRPSCDTCIAVDADAVLDMFATTLRK